MNAQVIQAEPVGEGTIDSIVIPPRAVSENRTTIVSIPQPPAVEAATSEVANRSIQVIRWLESVSMFWKKIDEQTWVKRNPLLRKLKSPKFFNSFLCLK